MRIVASAESAPSAAPDVIVLSSAGESAAALVSPSAAAGGPSVPGQFAYEVPLPDDTVVSVRAVLVDGRVAASDSKTVRTDGMCAGEVAFDAGRGAPADPAPAAADPAPADGAAQPPAPAASSDMRPAPEPEPRQEDAAGEPSAEAGTEDATGEPQPAMPAPEPAAGDDAPAPQEPAPQAPQEQEREPEQPGQGGGCLVATAAHGTELAPQVQALRELRDRTVLSTGAGSAFMAAFSQAYYAVSPHMADLEREHPALRQAVALALAPMLHALSVVSLAEPGSEAGVAAYGALAIALVAGMYVAAPAAGAWCLARRAGPLRGRQHAAGRSSC